jgi:hypothetical protein
MPAIYNLHTSGLFYLAGKMRNLRASIFPDMQKGDIC